VDFRKWIKIHFSNSDWINSTNQTMLMNFVKKMSKPLNISQMEYVTNIKRRKRREKRRLISIVQFRKEFNDKLDEQEKVKQEQQPKEKEQVSKN
jgi:hypothetical protein